MLAPIWKVRLDHLHVVTVAACMSEKRDNALEAPTLTESPASLILIVNPLISTCNTRPAAASNYSAASTSRTANLYLQHINAVDI